MIRASQVIVFFSVALISIHHDVCIKAFAGETTRKTPPPLSKDYSDYECPVCLGSMKNPVLICQEGHAVCGTCISGFVRFSDHCHSCRGSLLEIFHPPTAGDTQFLKYLRKGESESHLRHPQFSSHQYELLEKLRQVKVPAAASEELSHLLSTLEKKGIICKTKFVKMVEKVVARESAEASNSLSAQTFLQKANTFFRYMRTDTADSRSARHGHLSTDSLTTLVSPRKRSVYSFTQCPDERLKEIAQLESLKTLTSLCAHKRFPESLARFREFEGLFGEDEDKVPVRYRQNFTLMQNGRGVPAKEQVSGFWQWVKENDLETAMASLSNLLRGHGIPDLDDTEPGSPVQALKNFVGLFGEGSTLIPRKYLKLFTAINAGKGVPRTQEVRTFYSWLGNDAQRLLMPVARLFHGKGIPDPVRLAQYQSQLQELAGIPLTKRSPHLKILALYRVVPGQNNLSEQKIREYLSLYGQQAGDQKAGAQVLAGVLERHRIAGMEMYRTLVENNTGWDTESIMSLLMEARHLPLASVAIEDIWQGRKERLDDARQFLVLARNLKPVPTQAQWREFKEKYLPVLASVILPGGLQHHQCPTEIVPEKTLRFYWESLWKVTAAFRVLFQSRENLKALLKGARSIGGLHSLSRRYDSVKFQEQCRCLIDFFKGRRVWASTAQSLVDTHLSPRVYWYAPAAHLTKSHWVAETKNVGSGVYIRPSSHEKNESLKFLFGFLVNGLIKSGAYIQRGNHPVSLHHDGMEMQFDWPRLFLDETGMSISNWSKEQFDFFSRVSEGTAGSESSPDEQGSRLWISHLLLGSDNIPSRVWQQLEDNRHSLPHFVIDLLDRQNRPGMPEQLRAYVRDQRRLAEGAAPIQDNESAVRNSGHELAPEFQRSLLRELLPRQPVLTASILKELEPGKGELSNSQLEEVVTRLDINLPPAERAKWVEQYHERQLPQASLKVVLTLEQLADKIADIMTEMLETGELSSLSDVDFDADWFLR